MQTLQKTVMFFIESQEFFFSSFSFHFPADYCDHACNHGLHKLDKLLPPGIWTILVSLQNQFHLLMLAWEKEEECYLLEAGLEES